MVRRWVEYAISSSWMLVLILNLFGIGDLVTIIALAVGNVMIMYSGLIIEWQIQRKEQALTTWIVNALNSLVPWTLIFIVLGMNRPPWFAYAAAINYFVNYILFAVVSVVHIHYSKMHRKDKDAQKLLNRRVEFGYMFLSAFAKTSLAWLVIGGLLRP